MIIKIIKQEIIIQQGLGELNINRKTKVNGSNKYLEGLIQQKGKK